MWWFKTLSMLFDLLTLVSGEEEKERMFKELIGSLTTFPVVAEDGKLQDDVDVDEFLNRTPFHATYNNINGTTSPQPFC